jgi:Shikimate kinase
MKRVVDQGDMRPVANRANAMVELEALLAAREPMYATAAITVETSELTVLEVVEELCTRIPV